MKKIEELSIYEKMANIRDEAGVIAKNLEIEINRSKKYKAVSERDVLDTIRPLMQKYRVFAFPVSRECDERDRLVSVSNFNGQETTRTNLYFHYKNVMRFVNLDKTEEHIDVVTYSTGIDTGDKADGKAMTYADKYAFMKAFMLSTGDDPDQEASKEYKTTITNEQWESLKRMYSKDEIRGMYEELGITNGKSIPSEYFEKKKKEYDEKIKATMPEKAFY